jgi:carboxyl-terminal processing protease
MNKKATILLRKFCCLVLCVTSLNLYSQNPNITSHFDIVFHRVSYLLQNLHYNIKEVDDDFSSEILTAYLNGLDAPKLFFIAKDSAEFEEYRYRLDDEMLGEPVLRYKVINERYIQRLNEIDSLLNGLLAKPFKFTKKQSIDLNYENVPFAANEKVRLERWQNILKYKVLVTYNDYLTIDYKDSAVNGKVRKKLEAKARESVLKIETRNIKNLLKITTEQEAFQNYVNTITNLYDPHTAYFLPVDTRSFQEGMSGIYYGIGALLTESEGRVSIKELMIGGPAWKNGQVEVGDVFVKVQEENGEEIDVAGMSSSELIRLTRGAKGSKFTITFRANNQTLKTVTLIREALQLEDTFVKSAVIESNGIKTGYITFPKFYTSFDEDHGRSCTEDVAKEVLKLKAEGVTSIILDIRGNVGGSLGEVIDMVGLFVDEGPVVLVNNTWNATSVGKMRPNTKIWSGPLVVLVNETSASASEIFAAAIQDYKRGVIVGSSSTFGKGTVQRSININHQLQGYENIDLGTIHLTVQKYYRITGKSTQLKGVASDIILPGLYQPYDVQEKSYKTALKWDTLNPVDYQINRTLATTVDDVIYKGRDLMKNDLILDSIQNKIDWLTDLGDVVSLNIKSYQTIEESRKNTVKFIRDRLKLPSLLEVKNSQYFQSHYEEMENFKKETNRFWLSNLQSDLYLKKTVDIARVLELSWPAENKTAARIN